MGYDLYLRLPPSNSEAEIINYFKQRKHYSHDGSGIYYENKDTGVYFVISISANNEAPEIKSTNLHVQINYMRPTYFGLEAQIEMAALTEKFQCDIFDPQLDGMEQGPYSAEKFLNGWNKGNNFGFDVLVNYKQNLHTLPSSKLIKSWEWNYNREHMQTISIIDQFYPAIFYIVHEGKTKTCIVWAHGAAMRAPVVDCILISTGKPEAPNVASYDSVYSLLKPFFKSNNGGQIDSVYDKPPAIVRQFVDNEMKSSPPEVVFIGKDEIFDEELIVRARSAKI